MKRVLLLGAGLVSRPFVRAVAAWPDVTLTVGDIDPAAAARVLAGHPRGRAVAASVDDAAALGVLVSGADLVVSLLPATLHVRVATQAVAHRVPMITTSYVSADMQALDAAAREAGILILNEIGLDPGLDHMSAMRLIHAVQAEGARLASFRSCCGGLPASEANTNPWGYKFSWSPRGVLEAGRKPARWLENGRVVEVPGGEVFRHAAPYDVPELGRLEVYPNRDSVAYAATYGIDGVRTMFRGTLRYPGWCETMSVLARAGLLDDVERAWPAGTTHAEFMKAFALPGTGVPAAVMERLRFAGLFSGDPIGATRIAPIDVLCARLVATLAYEAGESDMIVLRHELGVVTASGRDVTRTSTLVAYGEPRGDSAMARTVALPAAVAARLILDGRIASTGVRIPVEPAIYEPVLDALAPLGIVFRETQTAP